MSSFEAIRQTIAEYTRALTDGDTEAMEALFGADFVIEDPVGAEPVRGADAVATRVAAAKLPGDLTLVGPICGTAQRAAAPLRARFSVNGEDHTIDLIDVFDFDDEGRITSLRAYWGDDNFT
jgi:steroid delta-isomerase